MSSKKTQFVYYNLPTKLSHWSVVLFFGICSLTGFAQSTQWNIDPTHARIGFNVTHFGISETYGKFTKFEGTVSAEKPDFSDAKVAFLIDANSINTENAQRDEHLRSADFFDTEKFPEISFKSRSIVPGAENNYKLNGDLTIHGVTKPVTLNAVYRGTVKDPFGNTKAGFKISGIINRRDWGLTWNTLLETGGLAVGEDVAIYCDVELTKSDK